MRMGHTHDTDVVETSTGRYAVDVECLYDQGEIRVSYLESGS